MASTLFLSDLIMLALLPPFTSYMRKTPGTARHTRDGGDMSARLRLRLRCDVGASVPRRTVRPCP